MAELSTADGDTTGAAGTAAAAAAAARATAATGHTAATGGTSAPAHGVGTGDRMDAGGTGDRMDAGGTGDRMDPGGTSAPVDAAGTSAPVDAAGTSAPVDAGGPDASGHAGHAGDTHALVHAGDADTLADAGDTDDTVIATRALTKRFRGGQLAVDGLDLAVPAGSVFGFLGPNGSGKTTTIRMLMGLIAPTSGTARVLGRPMPRATRSVLPHVGALIEGPALYGFLSGRDNLLRYDSADPAADPRTRRTRVATALDRVGLTAAAGKKAKAYSLGMKQRLGLAAALLQPRKLLVLDEPTNGLDPQGMREIRALVRELASDGTTVFLSSHLLDEIEQVCTHAAVMARGRLITQGPVADLAAGARGRLVVTTPDPGDAARVLKEQGVGDVVVTEDRVSADPPERDLAEVNAALVTAGVRVRGFGVERASLEDAFVALTGEGFDVAG